MNTTYALVICWGIVTVFCVVLLARCFRLAKENAWLRKELDKNRDDFFAEGEELTFDAKDIEDWSEKDWDDFDKRASEYMEYEKA